MTDCLDAQKRHLEDTRAELARTWRQARDELSRRENALDVRERALDERERAIEARERSVAA